MSVQYNVSYIFVILNNSNEMLFEITKEMCLNSFFLRKCYPSCGVWCIILGVV